VTAHLKRAAVHIIRHSETLDKVILKNKMQLLVGVCRRNGGRYSRGCAVAAAVLGKGVCNGACDTEAQK